MKEGITTYISNPANTIKYTTDKDLNLVAAAMTGTPVLGSPPTPFPYFAQGENIILESLSCRLPFCFGQAEALCQLQFQYISKDGLTSGSLLEIGNLGAINLPYVNSESDLNVFINMPGLISTQPWGIRISSFILDVSMLNMPVILDDTELDIYVVAKVHSTRAMET